MATVGRACLILALLAAVYGIGASLYGARAGGRLWVDSGRRAVYALAGLLTLAFAILELAFLRSDFSYVVVAGHSSLATPTIFKFAAPWSSQEGSLLLWVWLLSMWSSLVLFITRRSLREIAPYATAVLLGLSVFFCCLVVFSANPFVVVAQAPADGQGLNPLLRHGSMLFHPPILYSGYTLASIPFAFAIGALVTGRLGAEWMRATRRFALGSWLALGIGIILGARWSYTELGWGGYWGWDPVENASLMPWLTGTALIHSAMIQEKRGMLRVWNVSLVLATGILTIVGTFLVRSGVLDSIHAFTGYGSAIGNAFLALIATMIAASVGLVIWRRAALRSEHQLDSLLSREAIFLLQNLVLVALCFVIFWLTFFPLISEALTGTKASVGPPAFKPFVVPLTLVLVLLSGIGPVIAWRRATAANLRRHFVAPLGVAAITLVALLVVGDAARKPLALVMFCLAAFTITVVAQELVRGVRARRAMAGESVPGAAVSLVRRNRRRYGGYLVHAGFAVLMVGVAASSAFIAQRQVSLRPGQSARVGGYTLRYERSIAGVSKEKFWIGAMVDVRKGGHHVTTLRTARDFYPVAAPFAPISKRLFDGEPETQIGLDAGLRRDFWAAVDPQTDPLRRAIARRFDAPLRGQAISEAGVRTVERRVVDYYARHAPPASFNLIVSPLVTWLWIGALIMLGGALIAVWPVPVGARRRVTAAYRARPRRGLAPPAPVPDRELVVHSSSRS